MMDIKEIRKQIENVDLNMISLFEERMKLAEQVALYKKENNIPIFDKEREEFLIEKNTALLKNKAFEEYYKEFLQSLMDISKQYQSEILNK